MVFTFIRLQIQLYTHTHIVERLNIANNVLFPKGYHFCVKNIKNSFSAFFKTTIANYWWLKSINSSTLEVEAGGPMFKAGFAYIASSRPA